MNIKNDWSAKMRWFIDSDSNIIKTPIQWENGHITYTQGKYESATFQWEKALGFYTYLCVRVCMCKCVCARKKLQEKQAKIESDTSA